MCQGSDSREREILWSIEETMLSPEETLWSPEDEFVVNLYLNFQFLGHINLPSFDLMYPTLSSNHTILIINNTHDFPFNFDSIDSILFTA